MRWLSRILVALIAVNAARGQTRSHAEGEREAGEVHRTNDPAPSADFVVRTHRGGPSSTAVIARCESIRQAWYERWRGGCPVKRWESPCEIVIHVHRQSYLAAVGRAGGATLGSSLVRRHRDGSATRRIDLLSTDQGDLPALGHELVHVFLADHFSHGTPPLWVDEGLAMQLDTPRKQELHVRDFRIAWQTGKLLPLRDLLHLDRPTSTAQFPTVYGQSLLLTRFFLARSAPETLFQFLRESEFRGSEEALGTVYGIRSWDELEREWRGYLDRTLGES